MIFDCPGSAIRSWQTPTKPAQGRRLKRLASRKTADMDSPGPRKSCPVLSLPIPNLYNFKPFLELHKLLHLGMLNRALPGAGFAVDFGQTLECRLGL